MLAFIRALLAYLRQQPVVVIDHSTAMPDQPEPAPALKPVTPDAPAYAWHDYLSSKHSVRVICDEEGLTVAEKNLICACIQQESNFDNDAKCFNKDANGKVLSVDVGIVQVNSYYHCGPGKDFPSTEYVIANPEKAVRWMIHMYRHGLLKQWVSFSSGAYKKYLPK
jgi:hypothetical protein